MPLSNKASKERSRWNQSWNLKKILSPYQQKRGGKRRLMQCVCQLTTTRNGRLEAATQQRTLSDRPDILDLRTTPTFQQANVYDYHLSASIHRENPSTQYAMYTPLQKKMYILRYYDNHNQKVYFFPFSFPAKIHNNTKTKVHTAKHQSIHSPSKQLCNHLLKFSLSSHTCLHVRDLFPTNPHPTR